MSKVGLEAQNLIHDDDVFLASLAEGLKRELESRVLKTQGFKHPFV